LSIPLTKKTTLEMTKWLTIGSDVSNESGTESMPWIAWFCSLGGHQYFAEVADDFVEDDFNLTGLNSIVPFYKEALEMILDLEPGKKKKKKKHKKNVFVLLAENTRPMLTTGSV
jgi:hypothetical protein